MLNVVFSPDASTETRVTSASPIIRADAVDAVRCGFRMALPRASSPADPPILVAGQPSTRASGGTSVFASIATPTNTAAAPTPRASSRCVVESPWTNSPTSMSATAPPIVSSAAVTLKRAKREVGSTAPSRTAEIGGTRVARIAGRSAASSVTRIPTTSATTIVRVANTVPACGRSIPKWTKSAFSPFARPSPRKRPVIEARIPITSASSSTDISTWRRLAPSVRSVASSRVRCAIVIESVFAITKVPTKRATPPNASRKSLMIERKPFVSLVACAACPAAVRTSAVGGRIGLISFTSCCGLVPFVAAMLIASSFPSLWKIFCAVGKSKTEIVAPPSDETPPILTMPAILYGVTGPSATTPIVWPTLKFSLLAVCASIATSWSPTGHVPETSVSGLKRWSPRRVDAEREAGRAAAGDDLAVPPDEMRGRR